MMMTMPFASWTKFRVGFLTKAQRLSRPEVRRLTQDVNLILKALRPSTMVEVQGHKLRKRGNWMAWVSSSALLTQNKLVTSMQSLQLDVDSRMESRAAEMQPIDNHPTVSAPKDGELRKENLNAKGQWSC
ncbi:hypothetical protein ACLOJK_014064 [Asimina triloba]